MFHRDRRSPLHGDDLAARAWMIPDDWSRDVVGEALGWAAENPEALEFVHSDRVGRKGHLPNMVGFGNLLDGIERRSVAWGRPVEAIFHDRQREFAAAMALWHRMFSNARDEAVTVPFGGRLVLRRVFGSRLVMMASGDCAGIQAVDVVLWLFARSSREELPPNCRRLIDYALGRASVEEFGFADAELATEGMLDAIMATEPSEEMTARAAALGERIERLRREGMAGYAEGRGEGDRTTGADGGGRRPAPARRPSRDGGGSSSD